MPPPQVEVGTAPPPHRGRPWLASSEYAAYAYLSGGGLRRGRREKGRTEKERKRLERGFDQGGDGGRRRVEGGGGEGPRRGMERAASSVD